MDWKGLLNWSMNYQDGTVNKNLKPMSEEEMKFIESAFESVCINEMKEIMKILDKLKQPELNTQEDKENRLNDLENLLIFIEGPENARNVVRVKRFHELISYFFSTQYREIQIIIADVLTSMMQNDKYVQEAAMELKIFNILDLLNKSEDKLMIAKYIYLLTGIIFGESEKPKITFLNEYDGMKLLYNILIKNADDAKNTKRLLNLIKELTRIEDKKSENFKTRNVAVGKIKEIQMNKILMEILKGLEFDDNNLVEDNLDKMKIILQIFVNIIKLYDSLAEIFNSITDLNEKLNKSQLIDEDRKKEEKKYIIHILKSLKSEYAKEQDKTDTNSNENNVNIEENKNIGKQSMHLQLK
jgi:hypothetical protein